MPFVQTNPEELAPPAMDSSIGIIAVSSQTVWSRLPFDKLISPSGLMVILPDLTSGQLPPVLVSV